MLSVVMPAYNEAPLIEASVREWYDAVIAKLPDAELLVVDDCSTDGTGPVLEAMRGELPRLRVLRLGTNVGHGPAVRHGLEAATAAFVLQTDSDRQHAPEDFWRLWARRDEADFIFGVRAQRADGAVRAMVAKGLRVVNLLVWRHWIADANCPFKLMAREPMRSILDEIPRDAFIPMVMLSVLARYRGCRVLEVEVRHFPRPAGQPSITGLMKWGRVGWQCSRELLALRIGARRQMAR
jgi:glycosyltransferase involved in cell wall biosynthesis